MATELNKNLQKKLKENHKAVPVNERFKKREENRTDQRHYNEAKFNERMEQIRNENNGG